MNAVLADRPSRLFRTVALVLAFSFALSSCASFPTMNPLAKGRVIYNAPSWCVPWRLKRVLGRVASKFGTVTVHSTYRSWFHNYRVGGAQKSWHRKCKAVDFSVKGNQAAIMRYLRKQSAVGGLKKYRSGHIHIDVGPRRTW